MAHRFTSLRHPLEKLQEAEYFLGRLSSAEGMVFQFELNAFLSACRSVSFVLQKSFKDVSGFEDWYRLRREEMKADDAMRFFLELRNISQHQGPVSYIGSSCLDGGWSCRFTSSNATDVPRELAGRDIVECCAAHLVKLAEVLNRYFLEEPFHACPGKAFTEEGMAVLGYTFEDVELALGLPVGWTSVAPDFPVSEKLRVLSREIQPLEASELERMASGNLQCCGAPLRARITSRRDLVDDVADLINSDGSGAHPRNVFLKAVARRMTSGGDRGES